MQHLIFKVGESAFAAPLAEVEVVLPVPALEPLVGAPAHVAGLLSYRGRLIPVIDLSLLRGLGAVSRLISCRLVLVKSPSGGDARLALMVEKVLEVIDVSPAGTVPEVISGEGGAWLKQEVLQAGDLMVRVVHWEALLPSSLLDLVAGSAP